MRAFVVIASLVVLANADVKHLYDAPYNTQETQPGYNYGGPTGGVSGQNLPNPGGGVTGLAQQPLISFQPSPSVSQPGALPLINNAGGVKHLYDAPYNSQKTQNNYGPVNNLGGQTGNLLPTGGVSGQNFVNPNSGFVQQQQPINYGQQPGFIQPVAQPLANKFGGESVGTLPLAGGQTGSPISGTQQQPTNIANLPTGQNHLNQLGGSNGPLSNSGLTPSGSFPGNTGLGGINSGFGPVNGGGGGFPNNRYGDNVEYRTKIVKQSAPLVTKASYVFEAPEDPEDIRNGQTIVLPRPRQHYKVVFIKAPGSTVVNAPSDLFGGQTREKTLIYVLSDKKRIDQQLDIPELDQSKTQKPEVFFIKYRKPTQQAKSQIKYETVDAVQGAEYGAVDGVPNRVRAPAGGLSDEPTSPLQAEFANKIHDAIRQAQNAEEGTQAGAGATGTNPTTGGGIGGIGGIVGTVIQPIQSIGNLPVIGNVINSINNIFGDPISGNNKPTYATGLVQPTYATGLITPGSGQQTNFISSGPTNTGSSGGSEQGYTYGAGL